MSSPVQAFRWVGSKMGCRNAGNPQTFHTAKCVEKRNSTEPLCEYGNLRSLCHGHAPGTRRKTSAVFVDALDSCQHSTMIMILMVLWFLPHLYSMGRCTLSYAPLWSKNHAKRGCLARMVLSIQCCAAQRAQLRLMQCRVTRPTSCLDFRPKPLGFCVHSNRALTMPAYRRRMGSGF